MCGENVEPRGDRRVCGEDVAPARGHERLPETELVPARELDGAFDDGECGVAFVDVAYLDVGVEALDDAPAANPQCDLLHEPDFGTAAVKLRGNAAIDRGVQRVIAVQQIELYAA